MDKEYTIGLRVKDSDCNEHMTLAYCKNNRVLPSLESFKNFKNLSAKVTGKGFLGPNKDIPVWFVSFESEEREEITNFWRTYNVEQEHTKGLEKPNLHVTIKKESPERKIGDTIQFSSIFAKRVGKYDPYFHFDLDIDL